MNEAFIQNRDRKFDLQLSAALIDERRLGEIFTSATIEKTVTAACVNGFFTTVLLFDRAARKSASDCAGR